MINNIDKKMYAAEGGGSVKAPDIGGSYKYTYNGITKYLANDNGKMVADLETTSFTNSNDIPNHSKYQLLPTTVDRNVKMTDNAIYTLLDDPIQDDDMLVYKQAKTLFVPVSDGAGAHNSIYRGENLGSNVTSAQYAAIKAGTFEDLFIGDYWVIDGVNWRIAAFDYYLKCGDTNLTTHHAVIVPDTILYNAPMYDSAINDGGYVGSAMYTTNLNQAKITIKSIFNSHVLKHRVYLTNAVKDGHPSGADWYDSEVDLMNEQMVYGGPLFTAISDGSIHITNFRVEKSQLPLFTYRPDLICIRPDSYWLRDPIFINQFAYANLDGNAAASEAFYSRGVRPSFCIC